jgi:hypothetical protein
LAEPDSLFEALDDPLSLPVEAPSPEPFVEPPSVPDEEEEGFIPFFPSFP